MEVLPAVLALAGVAAGASGILQMFLGGPFADVVSEVLHALGIGGVPRDAKTERAGLLLASSSNTRIAQLGNAIYWAARLHGRVLSSRRDEQRFFVPAVEETAADLHLSTQQLDYLVLALQRDNRAALDQLDRTLPKDRDQWAVTWLLSEIAKLGCVVMEENPAGMIACLAKLAVATWFKKLLIQLVSKYFSGGTKKMPVACVSSHQVSTTAAGPGICCAAMPAGVRAHPTVGERWAAKDKKGHCIVCEIALSTAKNAAPGQLKIKRGKAGQLCPTKSHGCCALLA